MEQNTNFFPIMDHKLRDLTRQAAVEGLTDDTLPRLISENEKAGKLDDEKLAIINSLTPATVKDLMKVPLEPITDRQALNDWFRSYIQLNQNNPEVIERSLMAMVRDLITEMEKIDNSIIEAGNKYRPKQDIGRKVAVENALLFLEKHSNNWVADSSMELIKILSEIRRIANSYPGSDEERYGREPSNHAVEAIRLSLMFFQHIKTKRPVQDLPFGVLLDEAIESYVVNEPRAAREPAQAKTETYDKIRKVIAAEILPWILEVWDPIQSHLLELAEVEREINDETMGFRDRILKLLRLK